MLRPGWGEFLHRYLSVSVVNKAVAGDSARSFTDEGHFQDLINTVGKGDFVILQFGRNDRWLGPNDNGKQDAPGPDYLANATAIHPVYVLTLSRVPTLTLILHLEVTKSRSIPSATIFRTPSTASKRKAR